MKDFQQEIPRNHPDASNPMAVLTTGLNRLLAEIHTRVKEGSAPNAASSVLKQNGLNASQAGALDHTSELILSPAALVARSGFDGLEAIIDPKDKTRFHREIARHYYDGVGEVIARWSLAGDDLEGDARLTMEAILDSVFYALLGRAPENTHAKDWQERAEMKAANPQDYLIQFASQIVLSLSSPKATSLDLLTLIAVVLGRGALRDLGKVVKTHLALGPGDTEEINGALLLALVAMNRAGLLLDKPETLAPLLARKDTVRIVASRAKKATPVWYGSPSAKAETRNRIMMRAVLVQIGWYQAFVPAAVRDAMLQDLLANRHAYPKGIAAGQPAPNSNRLVKSLATPKLKVVSEDEAATEEAAKEDLKATDNLVKPEAAEPTVGILLRENEHFELATIDLAQIGLPGSGKTSTLYAWIDRLGNRADPLFAGAGDAVPGDRVTKTKRDAVPDWRRGKSVPGTKEVSQAYTWKFSETYDLRVHDYNGAMLSYEGEGAEMIDGIDPELRTEFGRASGFVVPIGDARLLAAARGESVDTDELAAFMEQVAERIRTALSLQRGREHIPVVVVISKMDQVITEEDFRQVYGNGRLIGDAEDAVLSGLRTEVLRGHALNSPFGTVSRAGQQAVEVIMTLLDPVFAALRPYTRQVEVVLTSALATETEGAGPSDGPAEALQDMMKALLPSFVAQTEDLLEAQRAGFQDVERMAKAIVSDCRALIVDPRFDALRSWVPGQRMVARKFKRSRLMGLTPRIKALGLDTEVSLETTNGGFKALMEETSARVAHTRAEYDLIERRISALKSQLQD